jgi:hypothetical protein
MIPRSGDHDGHITVFCDMMLYYLVKGTAVSEAPATSIYPESGVSRFFRNFVTRLHGVTCNKTVILILKSHMDGSDYRFAFLAHIA